MEELRTFIQDNPYLVGGVVGAAGLAIYLGIRIRSKSIPYVPCPENTVVLHTITPGPNAPSMSPFPLKLECYLRMANIPYVRHFKTPFSPTKTKTPWITYNGEYLTDSQFIIEYFNKKLHIDLNEGLSRKERATAKTIQVLVDEHLYWCLVYFRWICALNSDVMKHILPSWLFRHFVRRIIKQQLYDQGLGRHSFDEVLHIFRTELKTLDDLLGSNPYMMGDNPTEVDCSVFGILANFVFNFSDSFMSGRVEREFPSLYNYVLRMKDRYYPDDWDLACQAETKPHIFGSKPG